MTEEQLTPQAEGPSERSLANFLSACPTATGDPLERVALAESEGFTDGDAWEEGLGDVFIAADLVSIPSAPPDPLTTESGFRELALQSIGRGIIFVLPLGPISVLWSGGSTHDELLIMWLTVVLAWGLGMSLAFLGNSLRDRNPGSEISYLRHALWLSVAGCFSVVVVLTWTVPEVSGIAALLAGVQFVYVMAANALFVMKRARLLALALAPGALATAWFWLLPGVGDERVIGAMALATLVVPVLLALWLVRGPVQWRQRTMTFDPRTSRQFAVYGWSLAVMVLWLPARFPGPASIWLGLGLLLCLPAAELVLSYGRSRTTRLLRIRGDLVSFQKSTSITIALSAAAYASLLAVTLAVVSRLLIESGQPTDVVIVVAGGFFLVGLTQLFAAFCVSYQELPAARTVMSVAVLGCVAAPALVNASTDFDPWSVQLFLIMLVGTGVGLAVTLGRGVRTPMRHL